MKPLEKELRNFAHKRSFTPVYSRFIVRWLKYLSLSAVCVLAFALYRRAKGVCSVRDFLYDLAFSALQSFKFNKLFVECLCQSAYFSRSAADDRVAWLLSRQVAATDQKSSKVAAKKVSQNIGNVEIGLVGTTEKRRRALRNGWLL